MNPGVPIGQSDAVISGEKLMALHCALRESASSVVSGSGETVACEPGGEPPPPPPARTRLMAASEARELRFRYDCACGVRIEVVRMVPPSDFGRGIDAIRGREPSCPDCWTNAKVTYTGFLFEFDE